MNIAEQRRLAALDFAVRTTGHNGHDAVLSAATQYLSFLAPTTKPRAKKAPARRPKR